MRYKMVLPFSVLLFAALPSWAESNDESKDAEGKASKIKIEGFVRSVFGAENFKNGEVFHEARIEFKTKRRRGLRADVEVDFRTKNDDVQVNEAILDKKFEGGLRLKAGYDLKRFGLEYEESRLERPTIERSLIYRRMDVFNYTGRETVVVIEGGEEDAAFHDWSLGMSFSEAQNGSLVSNWQTDLSNGLRYGLWVQAGTHRIQEGSQLALAIMNSLWRRNSQNLWQAEWVVGLDPNQTEFETVFANDERVFFTGLNTLYGHYFIQDGEESLMAMGGFSGVLHDHRKTAFNSLGILLGLRYDLDSLRLGVNAELIGTNSPIDLKKRTYNESNARLEALFSF